MWENKGRNYGFHLEKATIGRDTASRTGSPFF
jgi:hypothetical protein